MLPDGRVAFSDSSTYTVKVAEAGAGVVRILARPFVPEPVTDRVVRAEKDRRLRRLEERATPRTDLRERRREIEELEFHTELSVIRGLRTTWYGHIWVLRRGEGPHDDGPIDMLAADGRYLGSYPGGRGQDSGRFRPGWSGGVRGEERIGGADGGGEAGGGGDSRCVRPVARQPFRSNRSPTFSGGPFARNNQTRTVTR